MSDGSGATAWSYDAAGRPITERRTISGITKTVSYTYNKAGAVASITNPSGRTIAYSYSTALLPVSAIDSANGVNYVLGAHYSPQGALTAATFGNDSGLPGGVLASGFNNRLQPATIRATYSSTPVIDLSYSYGAPNNGNVLQIANNRDSTRTQAFTYDQLDRVATAQTPNSALWGISYVYDAWGNLTNMNAIPGKTDSQNLQEAPASSKNQLPGFTYDAAGNLLSEGGRTYTYDAENRIKTAGGVTYTYDGDNLRVAKSNGRLYWRGMGIGPLTVTDATGALIHEFVDLGGRRVGLINSVGNRYYFWSDHLGSASVVTNAQGQIKEESDFYPFGGERVITDTLDNRFKFTGQEFDPETANYGFPFRFQSTRLGRFLSPDQVEGDVSDPQSWNRYAYVMNGPLSLLDPLGLASSPLNCDTHPAQAGGNCVVSGGLLGGSWVSVDGVDTPSFVAQGLFSSGAAVQCPQCQPTQMVGDDNRIYQWLASDQPRDCYGSEPFACPARGYDWVVVGTIAAAATEPPPSAANSGPSWWGTFFKTFANGVLHGVRQQGQSVGECINQNVRNMTFGRVDPQKLFDPSLARAEGAAIVLSIKAIPTSLGPAAAGPHTVRWLVYTMGGGALVRGLAVTTTRAGLQALAVAGAATLGTLTGSAINCR